MHASLTRQSVPWEAVIALDGASPDGLSAPLAQDARVRTLALPRPVGAACARKPPDGTGTTVVDLVTCTKRHRTSVHTTSRRFIGDAARDLARQPPGQWHASVKIYSHPARQEDIAPWVRDSGELGRALPSERIPYTATLTDMAPGTMLLFVERPSRQLDYSSAPSPIVEGQTAADVSEALLDAVRRGYDAGPMVRLRELLETNGRFANALETVQGRQVAARLSALGRQIEFLTREVEEAAEDLDATVPVPPPHPHPRSARRPAPARPPASSAAPSPLIPHQLRPVSHT
ncbi:hypothetical protein AB0N97_16045 [Streptomyces collinus]|uniref:hypothetical protein n=1 Tax=Streptomyces collinus TaxID=42684 RepID=UPI0034487A9F